MKLNFYLMIALAIIAAITGSLAMGSGGAAAATAACILMVCILVLGLAAGRCDSEAELARMASIESGRRIQVSCPVAARIRLEDELEALREVRSVVAGQGGGNAA